VAEPRRGRAKSRDARSKRQTSAASFAALADVARSSCPHADSTLAHMNGGVAIAVGAVTGLALGIVISVTTDLPLAPELGLVLGALAGWISRRHGA
jgi:hypothetical protein